VIAAEKLVANDAIKALVRTTNLATTRRVLRHTLLELMAPPWKRAQLRRRMRGYLRSYFPEYDDRSAAALADAFVGHWVTKYADDCFTINMPDIHYAKAAFDRYVTFEQPELFREAVERGAGVIAAGAHMGSISFGTFAMLSRVLDIPVERSPIVRICSDPEMERYPAIPPLIDGALRDFGRDGRIILTRRDPKVIALEMAETLEQGGVLTTNLDVMMGGRDQTPFQMFGKARVRLPALMGAAKVALRAGATILPWICLQAGDGFRLRFERPIGPVPKLGPVIPDEHPALVALSLQLRDVLQGWIRWHPEQWVYWDRFHRRLVT
jgi:lauroyl/myristoyl acyltransferase